MTQSTAKVILIAASILYGLAFIPSALFAMMSPMVSDGGPPAWLMLWIVLGCAAIPFSMLIGIFLAWISYRRSRYTLAVLLTVIPLFVSVIPFTGMIVLQSR